MKVLFAGNASANNSSIAIAGDANAPVSITQNLNLSLTDAHVDRITDGLYRAREASIANQLPSDQTARADSEKQIDGQIDAIRSYIGKKPSIALDLLEKLYASTASSASGRIRFRIKANIGICHHLLGNDEKAASYLCDAYLQAPEEPKAIANNVLGLVLSGDVKAALKFGTEQLKLYPENETLAGYLVQCAEHLPEVDDPLELVPPEQRKSSEVLTAYIYFLQKRGYDERWWAVAWEGAEQYKDDEALQYYAALAKLDKSSRDPQLKRTNTLSAGQRASLLPAVAVLKERWQQCLGTDERMRPDQAAIGHNLLSAYLQLRDFDSIRQFAAVALANPHCPSEVLEHLGRLSFLAGDVVTTRAVLAKSEDCATVAFLKFHLAAVDEDLASVAATPPEVINGFPGPEQDWCRVLAAVFGLEVRGQGFSEDELRTLLPLARDSKRAHIIIARKARKAGFASLSTEVYDKACSLVTPDSDYAGRATVAREAAERRDWNTIISLLDGYVSTEEDSQELDMLALAFANITPPRERGVEFYETLAPRLGMQHRYALFAGTLNYNRGALEQAENNFRQALEAAPRSLDGILALSQTYLRAEKRDAAQELLRTVDAGAVEGSPLEQMHLAQLLVGCGRPRDGIGLGYRVLCSTVDSAKVNLAYVGLILNIGTDIIPMPDVVAPDCWVRLENQHQETALVCVDDDGPNYRQERIPLDHPLAVGAMGLRVGDAFQVERTIGPPTQWTVQQILDKHVRAMQDVMENYERRFPSHPGLWSLKVGKTEDDISGLLDIIKEQSERDRTKLDLYLEKRLPMAVVASILRLDVLTVASRIRHSGNPIISNTGQLTDLDSAIRMLEVTDFELVVLDTYAAWSVVCGGMLPILARIFPTLAIPRSVVDQLLELRSEFDAAHDTDRMSLSWADGQFYRDTFTPEQLKAQGQVIRQRIDELCAACKVLPVDWKEEPAPLVQQMMDAVGSPHILDAAYLAACGNGVLLSEDLFYRQWAGLLFPNLRHAWLQAVLKCAVEAKTVARTEYADAIISLASFQHEYVSVDAATLVIAYEGDTTKSLERFSLLANCIGGRNADWLSHLNVTAEFLRQVADPSFVDSRIVTAVSMVTEKLLRHSGDNWSVIYAALLVHPRTTETVRALLDLWRKGHFLPLEPVKKALGSIRGG